MSFNPRFTRDTVLPMAEAAYAVFTTPAAEPALPAGYRKTALLQADVGVLDAITGLPDSARSLVERLTGAGPVFGLIANSRAARTVFVAFRGTLTAAEWLDDFDAFAGDYRPVAGFGHVHLGWMALYATIRDSLASNLATACAGCNHIVVTGHSLGAALAVLAAPDIFTNMPPNLEPALTTFGGPRTGLHDFAMSFNMTIDSCYRVVNLFDVVPHVPLPLPGLPYEHVGVEIAVDSGGPIDPVDRHRLAAYRAGLDKLVTSAAA
ncbi:lipase family protein [Mycobacterium botniense]|jgi:triacylglycerol lipase|uniref:Fungal lipase-type domain-containing protein n=1 Tax=Mycobacterium botniense TaxID=84962 RepID=A0A7I9XYX4_9MYCO|nr:lipase family protein [Mycobacterium botniense]GFG75022.1 hypothetical protein MBOT_23870 [Mycobacterium botniense]